MRWVAKSAIATLLLALACMGGAHAQYPTHQCRTSGNGASTPYCTSEAFVTQHFPSGSTTGHLATYADNTGQLLADGGAPPVIPTLVIGEVIFVPTTRVPTNFLLADGSSQSRTTYAALFAYLVQSATVTFTNGSPSIGWTNHGMSAGDKVKFFTTGSLPTNFTAGTHGYNVGTEYCVIATGLTTNAFEVSATCGGSAVTAGSAGSGTQTGVNAPWGDGDGSTTFTLPKLIGDFVRSFDAGAGIDTNRQFGAEQLDQMQGHFHSITQNAGSTGGIIAGSQFSNGSGASVTIPSATITIGSPTSDGTNGTPRTGTETRPRNQTLLPVIRYQ